MDDRPGLGLRPDGYQPAFGDPVWDALVREDRESSAVAYDPARRSEPDDEEEG